MTHTGNPAPTIGAGRPAAAAAARIVGITCCASVAGPVIHVAVPSARPPASSSIFGPSAASTTRTGAAPRTSRPMRAVTVSPVNATFPSRTSGSSASRYSRMCRMGLSNEYP